MGFFETMARQEAAYQFRKAIREAGNPPTGQTRQSRQQPGPHHPETTYTYEAKYAAALPENFPDDFTEETLKSYLQNMGDYDFEHFVADVFEMMGWETEVTQQSVDAGIDVVATLNIPFEEKIVIQTKRYGPNTTVGSPEVQQYASTKGQVHGADMVVIITTNDFTQSAVEIADQLNVKLVNGDMLVALVMTLGAADLVIEYIPEIKSVIRPVSPKLVISEEPPEDDLGIGEINRQRREAANRNEATPTPRHLQADSPPAVSPTSESVDDDVESESSESIYRRVYGDDEEIDESEEDEDETANSERVTLPTTTHEDNTTESKTDATTPHRWVRNMSITWVVAFMGTVIGAAGGSSFFTGVAGLVLIVAYLGLPVALFADQDGPSFRWRFAYVISALIVPPIAGGWYLIRCSDYERK